MTVTLINGRQEEEKRQEDGEDRNEKPRPLDVKV